MSANLITLSFPNGVNIDLFIQEMTNANLASLQPFSYAGRMVNAYRLEKLDARTVRLVMNADRLISDADILAVNTLAGNHNPAGSVTPPPDTTPPPLPQALRDKLQPGGGAFTAAEQMQFNRWQYQVDRFIRRTLMGSAE